MNPIIRNRIVLARYLGIIIIVIRSYEIIS